MMEFNNQPNESESISPINLSNELARLLTFISDVATAIRLYSDYNQGDINYIKLHTGIDVLWLSDCLHGFGNLSNAILNNNVEQIVFACDDLKRSYEGYLIDKTDWRPSRASFERHAGLFSLQEGIDIFESIRQKVLKQCGDKIITGEVEIHV
jgi:hypothetical protein